MPIKKEPTEVVSSMRIEKKTMDKIRALAISENRTLGKQINLILKTYLKEKDQGG